MVAGFSFGLLGPLTAAWEGVPIQISAHRRRAVLALLLLEAGRPVPAHRLVKEIWGADAPDSALNNLQVQVSALRRALRGASDAAPSGGVIVARHGGYVLQVPEEAVDVHEFARLAGVGHRHLERGAFNTAADRLRDALQLWRAEPLEEFTGLAFADSARVQLRTQWLAAVTARVEADLALGRHSAVVPELHELLRHDPLQERVRGQLMLALYRSGQQGDALRVYAEGRSFLADELGVDPDPRLQRLHEGILRQDASLRVPSASGPDTPSQPGSAQADQPVATVAATTPAIATPLTSLVGRAEEVQTVSRLLQPSSEVRLLTLLGSGGSGKTRVAIEVARRMAGTFEDGVWIVPLAAVEQPADVLPQVHRVVGVPEQVGQGLVDSLAEFFQRRNALLVLDNFEQVLDAAEDLLSLLTGTASLKVLVTSRIALGITGEHEHYVPPLRVPQIPEQSPRGGLQSDAVRLFVDRANATSGLRLTDENAHAIARICIQLDGLPLALELAAARTKVLTPEAMLPRLERSLAVLTSPLRDLPPRQRSLRATLDWSYRLLTEHEATTLSRLSVFSGGWTLEAASFVCEADDGELLNILAGLIDKSLVAAQDGGRFTMLRVVREYAAEKLESTPDAVGVLSRFVDWELRLAEAREERRQLNPTFDISEQSIKEFEAELPNLVTALRRAHTSGDGERLAGLVAASGVYWYQTGRTTQLSEWLRLALESDVSPRRRASLLRVASNYALSHGPDPTSAEGKAHEALLLFEELGNLTMARSTRIAIGVALRWQGRFEEAARQVEHVVAERRMTEAQPDVGSGYSSGLLGDLYLELGDLARAAPLIDHALHTAESTGLDHDLSDALIFTCALQLSQGQYDGARSVAERAEALTTSEHLDPQQKADILFTAGLAMLHSGHFQAAADRLRRAALQMLDLSYRLALPDALTAFGMAQQAIGELVVAARCFGAGAALRESHGLAMMYRHQRALYEEHVALLHRDLPPAVRERLRTEGAHASRSLAAVRELLGVAADALGTA